MRKWLRSQRHLLPCVTKKHGPSPCAQSCARKSVLAWGKRLLRFCCIWGAHGSHSTAKRPSVCKAVLRVCIASDSLQGRTWLSLIQPEEVQSPRTPHLGKQSGQEHLPREEAPQDAGGSLA